MPPVPGWRGPCSPRADLRAPIAVPAYATVYRGVSQVPVAATTAVPEPVSLAMLGTSLLALFATRRRR